jgi:hypothetical protein
MWTGEPGDLKLPVSTEHEVALLAWGGAVRSAHAILLEGMKILGDRHGSELSAHRTLWALRRLELQLTSGLTAPVLGEAQPCAPERAELTLE